VTWNCRGLCDLENRGISFTYLRQLKADVIALQETNGEEQQHRFWSEMWGGAAAWTHYVGLLLRKDAGLTFANEPVSYLDGRVLYAEIAGVAPLPNFHVYCVYAPAAAVDRQLFLQRLKDIVRPGARTVLLGDFNATPMPSLDRWPPSNHHADEWEGYRLIMEERGLIDLYRYHRPTTPMWTWRRTMDSEAGPRVQRSRIDHILVSSHLARNMSVPMIDIPPRSDHLPVVALYQSRRKCKLGRGHWRFNMTHLDDEAFAEAMEEECKAFAQVTERYCQQGDILLDELHAKWAHLKETVRQTSITFGIDRKKRQKQRDGEYRRLLRELRANAPDPNVDDVETVNMWINRMNEVESALSESVRTRIEGLRIRARVRFSEQGERSTAYFFRRLRAIQASSQITELFDDEGRVVSDTKGLFRVIEQFYSKLFGLEETSVEAQEALLQNVSRRLDDEERELLDRDIEAQEVLDAIRTAPNGSAPGPDGITFEFYKRFATILAPALARLYNESRKGGVFPLSFRQTHIILLPKRGELRSLANWRPISLSDCDIKILTRVLTYRMQRASRVCIHESQTGFIRGRSIFDNIHAVHLALQCGQLDPTRYSGAIMLLDQQKAYDRVDRAYLDRCLERFGIGPGFRAWIRMLGEGAQAAIRMGPKVSDWVAVRKGLRQGDPLSPLLYNFVLEPLLCTFRKSLEGIRLPGYTLRSLAFADDVAVAVSSARDVAKFHQCVRLHEQASSARLNADKTVVLEVGQLDFETPVRPLAPGESTRYLGIMFSSRGLDIRTMEDRLLNEITRTADQWQDRKLSLVGRALLANSCMLAKLWFTARIVPFSKEFEDKVQARVRRFIWGSKRGGVRKEVIVLPKQKGGLGLLPMREQSLALFGKTVAEMFHPTARAEWTPVAQFLFQHYLRRSGRDLSDLFWGLPNGRAARIPARDMPPFWHRVFQVWSGLQGRADQFEESWGPQEVLTLPLHEQLRALPRVPGSFQRLTTESPACIRRWRQDGIYTVGDYLEWNEDRGMYLSRDLPSVRKVNADLVRCGWTLASEALRKLDDPSAQPVVAVQAAPFSRLWLMGKRVDAYRSKDARRFLAGNRFSTTRWDRWSDEPLNMLRWKEVFSPLLEPKHQALLWRIQHGAIPVGRQLVYMSPEATGRCPYCQAERETPRHYFFDCPRVQEFWKLVGAFLDQVQTTPPASPTPIELKDMLAGLPAWKKKVPSIIVWYALAVWQIYRAHAECALDRVHTSARSMFLRWRHEVKQRIETDLRIAKRNKRLDRFKANWLAVPCQWFVFDGGGDEVRRGRVVFADIAHVASSPNQNQGA
jgi:exonuclease III